MREKGYRMKVDTHWRILALGALVLFASPSDGSCAAYDEVDVANGGSIKGKVTFEGALPEDAVEHLPIHINQNVCGVGPRKVVWVDVEEGALRGAFVFIDKIEEGKKWPEPEGGAYVIDQKGCHFRPWAQVVRFGSPIIIRNRDAGVYHNINARELMGVEKGQHVKSITFDHSRGRDVKRTLFNHGQPHLGEIDEKIKPSRSPYIGLSCEAHLFMFGFLIAPKHPYAVVVKENGSYTIDGVPPGTYTVKAWHPRLGLKRTKLTVPAGAEVEANFVFSR